MILEHQDLEPVLELGAPQGARLHHRRVDHRRRGLLPDRRAGAGDGDEQQDQRGAAVQDGFPFFSAGGFTTCTRLRLSSTR